MIHFSRSFRLFLILLAILVIAVLQFRSQLTTEYWRYNFFRSWEWENEMHNWPLNRKVRLKLSSPVDEISIQIDEIVKLNPPADEFVNLICTRTQSDSLIGAVIIWERNPDTTTITPLSLNVNTETRQFIREYFTEKFVTQNRPHPYIRPMSDNQRKLMSGINREVGMSEFYHRECADDCMKSHKTCPKAQTAFGIIWNHEYYLRALLPLLTEEIESNPEKFWHFTKKRWWFLVPEYQGILLTGTDGDTLYSYGKVQLEYDHPIQEEYRRGFYSILNGSTLFWAPKWNLLVNEHDKLEIDNPYSELWSFPHKGYSQSDESLSAWFSNLIVNTNWIDSINWLFLFGSLGILFLLIVIQIYARNRQRDFIAHVSHELRTPVAKLKLFAETLHQDRAVSAEKEKEYIETILHESDHLSVLIDNTLNLSRLDAGRMNIKPIKTDTVELITKIHKSYKSFLEDDGFELTLNLNDGIPDLSVDPEAIELAIRNLIDNAIKYSLENKSIEIEVKRFEGNVRITVSDRGIGIPDSKCKVIFRRFYRIKPKDREPIPGAGIGLSLVKEIVRRHRGKVWCESREGGGSRFVIEVGK